MRRLLHLLYWQAQFDARRPLLWLCGVGYLMIAGPVTLGLLQLIRRKMNLPVTGDAYLSALTIYHAIGSTLLVTYLAARAADERNTGFLAILQMTDLPAVTLTLFRLLAGLVNLAPLWLMRLPVYVWCHYLGAVTFADFLAAEAIVALVTVVSLTVAMACSQLGRSSQVALTMISGVLMLSQAAFYLPRVFMGLVRMTFGPVQGVLAALNEQSLAFSRWSLASRVRYPPADSLEWWSFLPGIAVHVALAAVAFGVAWRLAFKNVLPDDSPQSARSELPPRRVIGDAIAWQAVHLHHNRGRLRKTAVAFDLLLVASLVVAQFTLPPFGTGMLALAIAFRALTTAAMRAGVCVFYEIRDQTLSTLALLPRDAMEFFHSWRRGGALASKPEYLSAAVAAPLVWWNMGDVAAGFLGVMVGMLLAAPFGYLNSLCRFEWAVLKLALWVFPAGIACVILGFYLAAVFNPWLGLAVFSVVALLFHYAIVRQIPYYFQRAVERG
jgi:hypothetical protein